jgi:insulysin
VGHEAKGSLASLLKRKGLIESLSAGAQTDQRYSASFEISMSLTRQGLDSLSQVLDLVFQYLRLLRNAGALEWVWQESADLAGLHWRFQEKRDPSSLVVNLASNLQLYPPKYVVSAPYTYETYDPDMISRVLEMLTPARADIFVASRDYVSQVNLHEAIYGTPYSVAAIDAQTIKRWELSAADPALSLVRPNAFVPRDLKLFKPSKDAVRLGKSAIPIKLVEKSGVRLWYKQDVDFKGKNWNAKPRINVIFQITSPSADVTARASILSSLFSMLYIDSLVETTYDATAAGLSWSFAPSGDGMRLSVAGYHDKVMELLNTVTKPLVSCLKANRQCDWANQQRYLAIKDELRRGLDNTNKQPPYTRAVQRLSQFLEKRVWSVDRLLYELSLPDLTLDVVAAHARVLFDRVFIEGFVHGNADETFARKCIDALVVNLGSFPLPESDRDLQQIARLTRGFTFAEAHTNSDDPNHALELYVQYPETGLKWDVCAALFGAIAAEPCFDQLRTKEQLGYIVSCRARPMQGSFPPTVVGFAVLVQSSFKDPPQLEASARSFLDGFVGNLSHMPKEKFGEHKVSLLAQIEEKEVSMGEETARLWKEILIKRYQWDRKERLAAALASIDLPQLATFARTLVDVPRHSLSVGIYGQGRDPPRELLAPGDVRERIWSMASFKGLPPPYWGLELPASPASAGQHKQMR